MKIEYFDKSFREINDQMPSKVKEPCSSSITSANTMPTSVINSRAVLIVRLICHDEKVYEEIIFCKASQYKSQVYFPSHNNQTCTKRAYKQQSIFYQEEIKPMGFSLPLAFSSILIKLRQQK